MNKIKQRCRVWIVMTMAALFISAFQLTAFASDDIEDEVFYIRGYNESDETVSIGIAYLMEDEDGDAMVVALDSALSDSAELYTVWDWEDNGYAVIYPDNEMDGYGCVTFAYEDEDDIPSSRHLKEMVSTEKNEILTLIYVDEDYGVQTANYQVTGGSEVSLDGETVVSLAGAFVDEDGNSCEEPDDLAYVPALLMNEDGDAVAILTEENLFLAFDTDLSAVSGGYSFSGLSWIWIAVIAAAVSAFFRSRKRKKGGETEEQVQQDSLIADVPPVRPMQPIVDDSFVQPIADDSFVQPIVDDSFVRPIADDPLVKAADSAVSPNGSDVQPMPAPRPVLGTVSVTGISGIMDGRTYPVGNSGISFGRDVSSGIRFPTDVKGVSRNHCKLFKDSSGALFLMDSGSTYGTFLQGFGKLSAQQPVRVEDGAVFSLGSEKNSFKIHIM
ncbi:MAG: FHA domain-containing protein [Lachnospiraceae bacterium]|nr:FHA domain-containing protein [Lachnospiraceae bacterium]